jgi:hypothetical protein
MPVRGHARALLRLTLLLSCVLARSEPLHAAAPSLGGITPRGGQRGTEMILTFSGARLADTQEVLSYNPGFQVSKLEPVNDTQIKAIIKIAPDCRLGEHAFRLRTATGVSELRTFWVGALPIVEAAKVTNDFSSPQTIPLNVTVHGIVQNEEVHYFVVDMKKGQRLSAEIEGMRLGGTFFDPYLAILNSKRFELAACDDAPLLGQDAAVSILVPEDGRYIIQVRESAYGGNGGCNYRLHVGTFPRPLAVVPSGGRLGEEIEVRFLGDVSGPITRKIKLPASVPEGGFGLFAEDAGGISPSPLPFRLGTAGNVIGTEGNNSHQTATKAELPSALNGVIARDGAVDHYRFLAKKGQTFDVNCWARRLGSPLDSVMAISTFGGGKIIENDDSGGPDSYFRWTVPNDGEYVLTITDHLGKGGPTWFYRVEFTPVQATATVTIPKVAQYSQERQTIVVPRGNRFATLVNVARRDFGGDLVLETGALPAGVTMQTDTMAANVDLVPVVFEASASAPAASVLTPLTVRPTDPKASVASHYQQQADLILSGPGNSIYWRYDFQRTHVTVTEEVPFRIHIVEPKVPLVQNGSLNLRVVAERKPGFDAPITVIPVYTPPGVSSATSAVIAQGQTETMLVMNAAPNAAVRQWKFAVNATANVGNGPVWVSSQLATLEVAPPFVTFALERGAAEQGKAAEIFCKVQTNAPFDGSARVRLLGLPTKVTTPDLEITRETKELTFKVEVDRTSPPGQHRNLVCEVVIVRSGEPILHRVGNTELRIDVPLPPKPNQPAAPVVTTPPPNPNPAKPPEKRLSRLEKLRLEQEEREKAEQKSPEKK